MARTRGVIEYREHGSDAAFNRIIFEGDPLEGELAFESPDKEIEELVKEEMKNPHSFYSPILNAFDSSLIPKSWYSLYGVMEDLQQAGSIEMLIAEAPELPEVKPIIEGVEY